MPGARRVPVSSAERAELARVLETGPFSDALRLAIDQGGMKLATIERRLKDAGHPVARATLSFWKLGRRQPERAESMEALAVLEVILEVPPGSLRRLVGAPKPRGRWIGYRRGEMEWSEAWNEAEGIRQVLLATQSRERSKVEDILVSDDIQLDEDGYVISHDFMLLLRAAVDGADRIVEVYVANQGLNTQHISIMPISNCRLGRSRFVPDTQMVAFELLFERPLRTGETQLLRFRETYPSPAQQQASSDSPEPRTAATPETISGRVFRSSVHTFVLQAKFHPDKLPVRCYAVEHARVGLPERIIGELPLSAQHTVHLSIQNGSPGLKAIRWEWE